MDPALPLPDRDRIFERFWPADHRGTGAGLGLAIVRRIMEAHQGFVLVGDTPGGGLKFREAGTTSCNESLRSS